MPQASSQDAPSSPNGPAVSKLAAKVAHELNNPLDAVLRFVSLAQRKAKSGDYGDIERYLADAQFGLQRMAEVLRELMEIGREANEVLTRPNLAPLSDLIGGAMRTAAAQAEQKHITLIVKNLLPAEITAPLFDVRLSQVLANLMKNAVEASPEQSTVRITVGLEEAGPVTIRIEDSGPGIPEVLLPTLFTPFVTSKPKGAGLGLGLAISRELVIALGGTLAIENRPAPDHGCVGTVRLPRR